MKKVYIAGKVTGLPFKEVKDKFAAAELHLTAQGYEVINPVTHVLTISRIKKLDGWNAEMKVCIPAMLQCDELHALPCYRESEGAKLEILIAKRVGIKVVYIKKQQEKLIGYHLPDGGHATFTSEPDEQTLNALNDMVKLAKKNLK